MSDRLQVHLARMQVDVEPFSEESPNLREQRLEHIGFASNQDEVIDISAIADSVYSIQPLVQREQVIVGEDLARQVANGETALAFRVEERLAFGKYIPKSQITFANAFGLGSMHHYHAHEPLDVIDILAVVVLRDEGLQHVGKPCLLDIHEEATDVTL